MRKRLDAKGYAAATIERQGDREIRLELPINETSAFRDADQIVKYLMQKGEMTILDSDDNVVVTSSQFKYIMAQEDSSGYRYISFVLTEEGKKAFEEATAEIAERGVSEEDYSTVTTLSCTMARKTWPRRPSRALSPQERAAFRPALPTGSWKILFGLSTTEHTLLS